MESINQKKKRFRVSNLDYFGLLYLVQRQTSPMGKKTKKLNLSIDS